MPATLDLQKEFDGKFQAILIERRHELADVLRLGLERRWFGTSAIWTNGYPFEMNRQSLPSFLLLSAEGKVVAEGNPREAMDEIRDYLTTHAVEPRRGVDHIERAIEAGAYSHASELCDRLAEGKAGVDQARLAALTERLASAELASEIAAEKELSEVQATLQRDGISAAATAALERIVAEHGGTRGAETATALLSASSSEPAK